jgi:hypothetical protein
MLPLRHFDGDCGDPFPASTRKIVRFGFQLVTRATTSWVGVLLEKVVLAPPSGFGKPTKRIVPAYYANPGQSPKLVA